MSTLTWALFLPFIGALAAPFLHRRAGRNAVSWGSLAFGLASFLLILKCYPLQLGRVAVWSRPWLEPLGLSFSLMLDSLSMVFALLITGIGTLILFYARHYLSHEKNLGLFYFAFLAFMGAMLGAVVSANALLLVIFWELTSVSSFLLIGFWSHKEEARAGALKALFITSAGGLALLFAVLLLGRAAGTFELPGIFAAREQVLAHPSAPWILTCLLLGAFTKSAQWPFHIWLPNAMEAPTPVSAYLHAATMVKAGIFLLARFFPLFGNEPLWIGAVSAVGLITMVMGALQAVKQHDLKAILAYSTISTLGLITSLYGVGIYQDVSVNLIHIVTHACYKGALFLLVGIIDHSAGTRDIRKLGGLYSILPVTGVLMALAALSMCGVPPFLGFVSKELFLETGVHLAREHALFWAFPVAGWITAAATVLYSLKFVHGIFWGKPLPSDLKHLHKPPLAMKLSPGVLALAGLVLGAWPVILHFGLTPVALLALPSAEMPRLALWHGFTLPLGLSAAAIAAGLALYQFVDRIDRWLAARNAPFTFHQWYDAWYHGVVDGAARLTAWTLPKTLFSALLIVFGVMLAALGGAYLIPSAPVTDLSLPPGVEFLPVSVAVLIGIGLAFVLFLKDRVAKVLALGFVGFMVTFLFVVMGAPDLALTQFLVESVTLILFLLVLARMPASELAYRRGWGGLAAGVAGMATGVAAGFFTWCSLRMLHPQTIASYFLDHSLATAGGRNIVNVILVDFRGYDTLGEITVVFLAGLGIYSLLKGRQRAS